MRLGHMWPRFFLYVVAVAYKREIMVLFVAVEAKRKEGGGCCFGWPKKQNKGLGSFGFILQL